MDKTDNPDTLKIPAPDFAGDGGTIAVLRFTRAKAKPDAASG
jgi:hypothetical protein